MSGSSPGSSAHKRKASDLEDEHHNNTNSSNTHNASTSNHAAGPPPVVAPHNIAPSYGFQPKHPQQQHVASPSQSATGLSGSTPDGSTVHGNNSSGSMGPSRSNTLDSHRSLPNSVNQSHNSPTPAKSSAQGQGQQQQQLQVTGHHGLQSNTGGNKRIKTARACDSCRRKKIRCDVIEDGTAPGDPNNGNSGLTCAHCRQYGFETRFKKKREREREAELAAKAAAVAAIGGRPGLIGVAPGLGSPYGMPGAPGAAAALYRSSSGTFFPPGGIMGPGAPGPGLPHNMARHIPPPAGGPMGPASAPLPAMGPGPSSHIPGRYPSYDGLPPMTPAPTGSRIATQEWPPPPAPSLPLPAGGAGSLPSMGPSYRAPSWRESDPAAKNMSHRADEQRTYNGSGPPSRSAYEGVPPKESPSQRAEGGSGGVGSGAMQPPDARVLGPTSIAYIVHSQPFVPGAAIEAHDQKHHQTFEVGASGDGIIKFNRPPRRASATSGDDDEAELTAATEVARAANADGTPNGGGPGEEGEGEGEGEVDAKGATPNTVADTKVGPPSLADKVASRQMASISGGGSAAGSPSLGSGLTRVRLAADVAEKLANVYFSRLANMFPVVTKAEFLHLSPPPPLLLYAVCGIAALSREVPREVLLCVKTCLSSLFRETDVLSTSKGVTVRALLVLSLHSDVHGSTAMQSGARCWNRTGCAVRMAQDLGLHRDATGRDDEDDDQFFLEQKRRIWGCCVTADRILSISLGHPLAIDLTDCDVRLPSPYEVKRWAEDPSADPTTDRPFAFNTEMLKLSILFGRVMKTIYSPTGLMKTTDEEISGLLRDIDTWRELLPPELQFTGLDSSSNAGILHVAFACLQMLFWRVFLRISYICPTHLKFSLNIERMTLLITWSREAILWVDRNEFYLDTLQLVSYSLVFCATVQYHAWVRRGETDALEVLRTCRDCVNRFKRPDSEEGEDLSMRAKTAGVITMLYEAASGVYANSPVGSQLNPTAGVINRRAVETLRGIVFRADSSRPGGGVYVAANSAHVLQDLPTGTIIHEKGGAGNAVAVAVDGSDPHAAASASAAVAAAAAQQHAAAAAAANANGVDKGAGPNGGAVVWTGGGSSGDSSTAWSVNAGASGDSAPSQFALRPRRSSKTAFASQFGAMYDGGGLTTFQIPPEAGMGRAVTAHISENGPIQLELQQPLYVPPQTSSGLGGGAGSGATDMHGLGADGSGSGSGSGGAGGMQAHQQEQQQQGADAGAGAGPPFGLGGNADPNMMFLQSMNVNPLLNELHWPSQPIMVASGPPELMHHHHLHHGGGMGGVSMAGSMAGSSAGADGAGGLSAPVPVANASSALANGGGAGANNNFPSSSSGVAAGTTTSMPASSQAQEYVFDGTPQLGPAASSAMMQSGGGGAFDAGPGGGGAGAGVGAGVGMGMGMNALDPSVLDGLPVSGLDFGAWDNFFSRFTQLLPNGDGSGGAAGGGVGGGPSIGSGPPGDPSVVANAGYGHGGGGPSF
ncbi:hypothetical protein OC844_000059 [Tilletia horrida]|nr:hypothetical protein OC844_000059 [Tilletia horrida]